MYTKPTAPRSIGGVLDDSIRLYREGFAKAWPLALGAQAIVAVPAVYFRLKLLGSGMPSTPQAMLAVYASPSLWVPYFLAVIASLGFYNAITLQLSAQFHGQVVAAGDAVSAGFRLLPRVILLFLCFGLACGIAVIAGMLIFSAIAGSAVARAILSILAMLAICLAFYVFGRVYLTNVALVVEDLAVFKSVSTSWALTRGNWWRGATIYSVIILIVMVFYFVIGLCTGLVTVALGPKSLSGITLTELFALVGGSLVLPLITATLLGIYNDFKLRNEGADLADRVNALAPR